MIARPRRKPGAGAEHHLCQLMNEPTATPSWQAIALASRWCGTRKDPEGMPGCTGSMGSSQNLHIKPKRNLHNNQAWRSESLTACTMQMQTPG
ncbi:hypothetical protein [Desulforamulus putei]|uniref:hypothetical protein n=1 Tax=Desulforamulus putei TaxID=74701 RepID=UPI001160117B|nr:hypothetical protein [Desulforamulus putei]